MFHKIDANSVILEAFLIKLEAWGLQRCWKETPAHLFFYEFCEILNTCVVEHL